VAIWLPDNYQLLNDLDSSGEIIPKTYEDNRLGCLDVPMYQFAIFFERSKDKVEVSIIHKYTGFDIIYRINCQMADKSSFIIQSMDSHNCGKKHFLKPIRHQEKGILLLEFERVERDWPLISFLFALILIMIGGVSAILWVCIPNSKKKPTQSN
jgi:hypothetical protein